MKKLNAVLVLAVLAIVCFFGSNAVAGDVKKSYHNYGDPITGLEPETKNDQKVINLIQNSIQKRRLIPIIRTAPRYLETVFGDIPDRDKRQRLVRGLPRATAGGVRKVTERLWAYMHRQKATNDGGVLRLGDTPEDTPFYGSQSPWHFHDFEYVVTVGSVTYKIKMHAGVSQKRDHWKYPINRVGSISRLVDSYDLLLTMRVFAYDGQFADGENASLNRRYNGEVIPAYYFVIIPGLKKIGKQRSASKAGTFAINESFFVYF
ncbi:MAG: hypothetical protein GY804_07200 [Alphaproteobacteria bacterium]|nr:hypothetical protein [Alphaproteobacteria bacterium]